MVLGYSLVLACLPTDFLLAQCTDLGMMGGVKAVWRVQGVWTEAGWLTAVRDQGQEGLMQVDLGQ